MFTLDYFHIGKSLFWKPATDSFQVFSNADLFEYAFFNKDFRI